MDNVKEINGGKNEFRRRTETHTTGKNQQNGSTAKMVEDGGLRKEKQEESDSHSWMKWTGQVVVCMLVGALFGFTIEKGRVFEPAVIQQQMLFQRFVMLKMFLSAVTSGLLCLSLLSILPWTSRRLQAARCNFTDCIRCKSWMSGGLGGALLGSGMAISGACPSQIYVQVGNGVPNAMISFLGGCAGVLLYGILEKHITKLLRPRSPSRHSHLDELIQLPFAATAFPLASGFVGIIFVAEMFVPWKTDLTEPNPIEYDTVFHLKAWPPFLSGAIAGCLQIPIILAVNDTLGGSSSYCTMVSRLFPIGTLRKISPYLLKAREGISNWWQTLYMLAAIGGAYYSAYLSNGLGSVKGSSMTNSFIGGVIMLFGSRLAGGCTCGHGLSGMGTLTLLSFVVVPAMFIGGTGTAVLTQLM